MTQSGEAPPKLTAESKVSDLPFGRQPGVERLLKELGPDCTLGQATGPGGRIRAHGTEGHSVLIVDGKHMRFNGSGDGILHIFEKAGFPVEKRLVPGAGQEASATDETFRYDPKDPRNRVTLVEGAGGVEKSLEKALRDRDAAEAARHGGKGRW